MGKNPKAVAHRPSPALQQQKRGQLNYRKRSRCRLQRIKTRVTTQMKDRRKEKKTGLHKLGEAETENRRPSALPLLKIGGRRFGPVSRGSGKLLAIKRREDQSSQKTVSNQDRGPRRLPTVEGRMAEKAARPKQGGLARKTVGPHPSRCGWKWDNCTQEP